MQGWSRAKLLAVIADVDAPVCKVAAARAWLDATSQDRNQSGAPIAGPDLDRIIDHTEGKPTQTAEVRDTSGKLIIQVNYTQAKSAHPDD